MSDWETRMAQRAAARQPPPEPLEDYEARPEVPPEVLQKYLDIEAGDLTPAEARERLVLLAKPENRIACACAGTQQELWQYRRPPCFCQLYRMALEQRAAEVTGNESG